MVKGMLLKAKQSPRFLTFREARLPREKREQAPSLQILLLLFFFLVSPSLAFAQTKVTADIDQSQTLQENVPIKGTIMVTHSPSDKIDESSFTLKNKKLNATHVQDVPLGNTEVISIYSFELPGQNKGLQMLDEVTVKVGSYKYSSVASTYEIGVGRTQTQVPVMPDTRSAAPAAPVQAAPAPSASTKPASLRLEQQVDAPDPFYPGKRATLIYRYIYSGDIELSKEFLPLMKADGFLKIGEEEIKDFEQGGFSIRQITQIIQATKPGTFSFEPAVVEGKAYTVESSGRRSYNPVQLHAETTPIKIEVKPLPMQNKPQSFTGAVGKYTFQVKLNSSKEMNVGDKLSLNIAISGPADTLANVQLPDLCCVPGMSGLFKLSDLPPSSVIKDNVKQFTVEMRPLSANAREIPSLEFSYFDTDTQQFKTLKSEPIPIIVREIPTAESPPIEAKEEPAPKPVVPKAIEIGANYRLTEDDLSNQLFGNWSVFWLIPFGIGLILFERNLKQKLANRKQQVKPITSEAIFNEAMAAKPDSPLFYQKINQAFMLMLVEKGEIASVDLPPESLSDSGASGEVKKYLNSLEEERFSGKGKNVDANEAKQLFKKLKGQKS